MAGLEPIMPTYKGQVNEEEMIQLIAFIKSLGRGQTPPREDADPAEPTPPAPSRDKRRAERAREENQA